MKSIRKKKEYYIKPIYEFKKFFFILTFQYILKVELPSPSSACVWVVAFRTFIRKHYS